MNYKVLPIPPFDRQLKRLSKKYASLKEEYLLFIESIEKNPDQGVPPGDNCYKIRLSIASKGKGKIGGARIITFILIDDKSVYLLSIFDKSEKENLSDGELKDLLQFVP